MIRSDVLAILLIAAAGPAGAASAKAAPKAMWPGGLLWCSERAAVQAALPGATEAVEDILELKLHHWKVDGFIQASLEEDRLVSLKFRVFQNDKAKVKENITAGVTELLGTPAESASKLRWTGPDGVAADLKLVTEIWYLNASVPEGFCGAAKVEAKGLSEQEKKDLDASTAKRAVDFDPLKDDPEALDKKLLEEKAKRKEEEKKKTEKKKEDEKVEDKDIDW